MKKSTFSPTKISGILKVFDNGKSVEELTREHGVSRASLYKWRQRYGGMDASEMKRIKELEEENARLKRYLATSSSIPRLSIVPNTLARRVV